MNWLLTACVSLNLLHCNCFVSVSGSFLFALVLFRSGFGSALFLFRFLFWSGFALLFFALKLFGHSGRSLGLERLQGWFLLCVGFA